MWGGSYLIHSPWVLPTLLGDYFTASGGREREGGGEMKRAGYIEPAVLQNLYHGSLHPGGQARRFLLRRVPLSLVQIPV